jgi:hypothetical protein
MQTTYAALWDFADEIENGRMSIEQGDKLCLQKRNAEIKRLKQSGFSPKGFSLGLQLRPYWRFGEPCGLYCKCYGINY